MHFMFENCLIDAAVNCRIIKSWSQVNADHQTGFLLTIMHMCSHQMFYSHVNMFHTPTARFTLVILVWIKPKESLWSGEFPSQYLVQLCCHLLLILRKKTMKAKWDAPPLHFFFTSPCITLQIHFKIFDRWNVFWFTVDNRSWRARCDVFECAFHSCRYYSETLI